MHFYQYWCEKQVVSEGCVFLMHSAWNKIVCDVISSLCKKRDVFELQASLNINLSWICVSMHKCARYRLQEDIFVMQRELLPFAVISFWMIMCLQGVLSIFYFRHTDNTYLKLYTCTYTQIEFLGDSLCSYFRGN